MREKNGIMNKTEASKLKAILSIASIDITLEFDRILHSIMEITCVAMNAHSGTIMLVDEATGEIRIAASHGLGHDYIEKVSDAARKAGVNLASGPQGTAIKTGTFCPVPNIFEEPGSRPWHDISKKLGFSSQIFAPIKKGTVTTGLIGVNWAKPRQFTDDEINFVKDAASHAAIVIQNAQTTDGSKNTIMELKRSEEKYRNGEQKFMEIRRRLVKDGDRITAIHGLGRDITENMKMEQQLQATNEKLIKSYEELKEAEEKYRDLFENAGDYMYTLDTEGYFQTINSAGLKILGCTKEEVIGTHISKWLTQESLVVSQEVLKKQISGENLDYPVIIEVICKNKEHRWGEVRTRYIKDGNRITGVHGIARDITEKKRLEMQLQDYNEKLERSCEELIEADRVKTEFISKITHELLTPLTSIKGFTELLSDETCGDINEEQKKKLDIIYRNTEKLIGLIKELLDIGHLEKNKFGLQFGLVSMNDIITRSIKNINQQAKEKDISIIRDIKKLPGIWGDEERLTHVLTNILANAIKFTPSKGTVKIMADEDKMGIKISVTDTGIGIPEDKLTCIFERFYQIDSSSNRRYGGAGLGLSICKSIIENHYGSIWAESTGCGSTFNIVLPKLAQRKKKGV